MSRILSFLLIIWFSGTALAGIGPAKKKKQTNIASGDLYLVCIGIDDYRATRFSNIYQSCKRDAEKIANKINTDYLDLEPLDSLERGAVHSYMLLDENANSFMIREVFRTISQKAKPQDHFIFFYAGITWDIHGKESLIPYYNNTVDSTADTTAPISLEQLASWMEAISAKNQLIISEAGYGESFAKGLMKHLFENNAILASESQRNRIILTTKEIGQENGNVCGTGMASGYLAHILMDNQNIFNAFSNYPRFEFNVINEEMKCPDLVAQRKLYTELKKEEDYRWLLVNHQLKLKSRGIEVEEVEDSTTHAEKHIPKNYALVISTNDYPHGKPSWDKLENPRSDALAIAELLETKYGFEVIRKHNPSKDSVTWEVKKLKRSLQETDKLLVFIAGHGYFDKDYNEGFLIFNDGICLNDGSDDSDLDSYLSMTKLNNLVNSMPSKNVFIIFDVCFGATFDVFAKDIRLSDYKRLIIDGNKESFYARKDSLISRIYMASGIAEVPDQWSLDLRHSPFAGKLIKALEEEEDFLSPGKIYEYMEGNITTPYMKQFGTQHHPRGDFIMPVLDSN